MSATTGDAIVVGAGVIGTSIALELRRAGFSCLVVDRARSAGDGSTSASSGIVRFNYPTRDGVALAWESSARWDAWAEHLRADADEELVSVRRCGMAFLDVPIFPRERMVPLMTEAGVAVEEWGPDELRAAFPGVDAGRHYPPKPVTSEEFFADPDGEVGAVFTPEAGYVADPRLAVGNLAAAGTREGVRFVLGRSVTSVSRDGDTWRVGLDDGHVLEAAVVVNAAGPWAGAVNRLAGVGDDFTVAVRPLRQEVHHLASPEGLGDDFPVLADADLGIYLRPDGHGHLLVGGTEPECDPLDWLDDPDDADPHPTLQRFEEQVWRAAVPPAGRAEPAARAGGGLRRCQ
jgi:sarcosine oxidase subunit beta